MIGAVDAKQFGESVIEVEVIEVGIGVWAIGIAEGLVEVEGDEVEARVVFHLFEEKT